VNVTHTELEELLKKAEEHSLIAKLATDPKVCESNELLANKYFEMATKLADSQTPPQAA
jgi:hypothetical protein